MTTWKYLYFDGISRTYALIETPKPKKVSRDAKMINQFLPFQSAYILINGHKMLDLIGIFMRIKSI